MAADVCDLVAWLELPRHGGGPASSDGCSMLHGFVLHSCMDEHSVRSRRVCSSWHAPLAHSAACLCREQSRCLVLSYPAQNCIRNSSASKQWILRLVTDAGRSNFFCTGFVSSMHPQQTSVIVCRPLPTRAASLNYCQMNTGSANRICLSCPTADYSISDTPDMPDDFGCAAQSRTPAQHS